MSKDISIELQKHNLFFREIWRKCAALLKIRWVSLGQNLMRASVSSMISPCRKQRFKLRMVTIHSITDSSELLYNSNESIIQVYSSQQVNLPGSWRRRIILSPSWPEGSSHTADWRPKKTTRRGSQGMSKLILHLIKTDFCHVLISLYDDMAGKECACPCSAVF